MIIAIKVASMATFIIYQQAGPILYVHGLEIYAKRMCCHVHTHILCTLVNFLFKLNKGTVHVNRVNRIS